jgi:phosphoglycolate phosphatase
MLKPFQYKHIIWDWNGTLLDDGWLFVDVMNTILKRRKMNTITLEKYREIFGFPVKNYYIKLGFDLEKEPFEESGMEFIRGYESRRYEAQLYPQVILLLSELQTIGISHSILSAQHQTLLDDLTQYYNIHDYFIKIIGLDNHYAHSKVENGIRWVNKLKLNPQEILLIGDTDHDFEVAETIGINCLLLSHGHHSPARLQKTGATVVQRLNDVFQLFKTEINLAKQNQV